MDILIFLQTLKRKEVGNGFWKNVNYWKILWCNIIFRIPIPEELCQNKKNFSGFFFSFSSFSKNWFNQANYI